MQETTEGAVPLERHVKRLIEAKKRLPFAGKGGGTSKKYGCCPRCGSVAAYRYHEGRWKRCSSCGYSRLFEEHFDSTRWAAKRGRQIPAEDIRRALEYFDRVYGA